MRLKSQTEQRLVDLLHDKKFSAFVSKLGKPKSTIEDDDYFFDFRDLISTEIELRCEDCKNKNCNDETTENCGVWFKRWLESEAKE